MFEVSSNNTVPKVHTVNPEHVGSSILGIKFNKGVILAGDTRLTVHGYKKYENIQRVAKINKNSFIGCSGEYSDFKQLEFILKEKADDYFAASLIPNDMCKHDQH